MAELPPPYPFEEDPDSEKKTPQPSHWQELYKAGRQKWEERPSLAEIKYLYIPMALFAAGAGVATVDGTFDVGIAKAMAEVRVEDDTKVPMQALQVTIRTIGETALEIEGKS